MVLISVILPSYNHEKFISEAINSILNQTFTDFELIIIDNNSTDNSQEIIRSHQAKDNRIKTLFHKKNEGLSKSLNDGIELSEGKYIAIICTDDLWDRTKLDKQFKIIENDENLIVFTEGEIIDSEGNSTNKLFTRFYGASKKKKNGRIFYELLKGNFICLSSLLFKKENLGDIRFYEKFNLLCDYKFDIDLAIKYKFYFISEPLTKYRMHGNNLILIENLRLVKEGVLIRKYFLDNYYDLIPKSIKLSIYSRIISYFLETGASKKALPYILKTIMISPLNLLNLSYIIRSLTKNNRFINVIGRIGRKFYILIKNL